MYTPVAPGTRRAAKVGRPGAGWMFGVCGDGRGEERMGRREEGGERRGIHWVALSF